MGEDEEKIADAIDESLAAADTEYDGLVRSTRANVVVITCVESMRS